MENNMKRYGLGSLLPLIIGSVVGIGSYFKIGKILKATGGSSTIAIWTWLIAIFIIFCSLLVLSEMISSKDNEEVGGGIVHLIEANTNLSFAKLFNQFFIFFYLPVIVIIEAVVAAQFLFSIILGIDSNAILIIGSIVIIASFMIANGLSVGFGKVFQSSSLAIKLLPLTLLIVVGLLVKPFTDPSHFYLGTSFATHGKVDFWTGIIAAMPGALFALDAWQWITNLSSETKGGVTTLVKAIIIGVIAISAIYILYTLGGLSVIKGSEWASGGEGGEPLSIAGAFAKLFGENIGKLISMFIVFAALGGLNAFTIYYNRQIHSAAERGWLPNSQTFAKLDEKSKLPKNAAMLGLVYCLIMWAGLIGWLYVQPTLFGTTSSKLDITASINLASDIWAVGMFGFAYIALSFSAFRNRNKDIDHSFRLPSAVFYFANVIMMFGGAFAIYVNFLESSTLYIVGVVLLLLIYVVTPKGHEVDHSQDSNDSESNDNNSFEEKIEENLNN